MVFNLLAIIFVIILYPMLHKDMGQNISKELTSFSLGMRAKKAEFVLPLILSHLYDMLAILNKSFLMISQQTLMKLTLYPSGPGALSSSMSVTTSLIYSIVIL